MVLGVTVHRQTSGCGVTLGRVHAVPLTLLRAAGDASGWRCQGSVVCPGPRLPLSESLGFLNLGTLLEKLERSVLRPLVIDVFLTVIQRE